MTYLLPESLPAYVVPPEPADILTGAQRHSIKVRQDPAKDNNDSIMQNTWSVL